MQEDTPHQSVPPPLPQVVYFNTTQPNRSGAKKWPGILAIISIVMAGIGVIPALIFILSCFPSYSFYGGRIGPGLSHLFFFFIGFILHGLAGVAGLLGMLNGARLPGFIGLIANGIILLLACLGLLFGLSGI